MTEWIDVPVAEVAVGDAYRHAEGCPNAPKPAEPPACRICGKAPAWNGGDWCRDCSRGKGELQSEPPIDHRFEAMYAAWKAEQAISIALRAELDALKAEVENVRQYARIEITDLRAVRGGLEMRLQTELAENAALKARVEELETEKHVMDSRIQKIHAALTASMSDKDLRKEQENTNARQENHDDPDHDAGRATFRSRGNPNDRPQTGDPGH